MKKIISFVMCIVMIFTISSTAFATEGGITAEATNYDGYPLVIVRGIDFGGFVYEEDDTTVLQVKPLDIISTILDIVVGTFVKKDKDAFLNCTMEYVDTLFSPISNDKNGNSSLDNVTIKQYPLSIDNYPEFVSSIKPESEAAIMLTAIEKIGAENVYYFTYDWRASPLEIATQLDDAIETAKEKSGKDKVNLACASMGGMIGTAYLYSYGCESVTNMVFLSSAHNGCYMCGEALSGDIIFSGDTLYNSVKALCTESNIFIDIMFAALKISGIFDVVAELANAFVSENKDVVYGEVMRENFGTFFGFWGLCPDELFQKAKDFIFASHEEEYSVFLQKLDDIEEFVYSTEEVIDAAYDAGINVSFVAGYDTPLRPLFKSCNLNGDGMLETVLMSNFATVAPYGEVLSDETITSSNYSYVSPDRVVDASTARYKDYTWFIKNGDHVGCDYGTTYCDFAFWLILNESQPTIYQNEKYPQFLVSDNENNIFTW